MTARLILKMNVAEVRRESPAVCTFTFRHPWRAHLPPPEPGAHVDLRLPDGRVRQYSLCGDPDDDTCYRIAVKREDDGRGASRWVHENLRPGSIAHVSTPRNHFPLADGARHLLVAGGIGVTPILPMARRLARRGAGFEVHYCARDPQAPLIEELRAVCGTRLATYFSAGPTARRLDVAALCARADAATHLYCCGPLRLTEAVRAATADRPESHVHFEVFKPALDEHFVPEPFDIAIASTGETVRVPAHRSALDVLRERGFILPSACELGLCGSCECRYLDGTVIHRDSILKTAARQDRMMLCVSRARVRVTLDL